MPRNYASGCLILLLGCGPVVLGDEESLASPRDVFGAAGSSAMLNPLSPVLDVSVSVRPVDCGRCFELDAIATGGRPPYVFEWEDGSFQEHRRVCLEGGGLFTVVARDDASVRSAVHSIRLESLANAGCSAAPTTPPPVSPTSTSMAPPSSAPASPSSTTPPSTPPSAPLSNMLCLENLSFEGTPTINFGLPDVFDAVPWSSCTNSVAVNTPNIVNDAVQLPESLAKPPRPRDGDTYLALAEGYQTSQSLCQSMSAGTELSVELDLARIDVAKGLVPTTEGVFLEVWGGLKADCSQRELLWASPPLETRWKRFCVTLRPHGRFDQLTLRANSDGTLDSLAFLIADNMSIVDACP